MRCKNIETFAKPKIVILSSPRLPRPLFVGGEAEAVRNISKFCIITYFEILHYASLHSE